MKPLAIKAHDAAKRMGMSYSLFKKLRVIQPSLLPPGFRYTPNGDWYYLATEVDAWVANKAHAALAEASATAMEGQHA